MKEYQGPAGQLVDMYGAYEEPVTRGLPPQSDEEIRNWVGVHLENGLNVVARHDWRIVGHATLVPVAETAELLIFVHPAEHSMGIGTQLVEGLLGHGQEHGVKRVWLSVSCQNLPLIRLTTGIGFEPPASTQIEFKLEREL